MKAVAINHNGRIRESRLLFPEGICVGCAKQTQETVERRNWGYSNAYFKSVSFPMCKWCQALERARLKEEEETIRMTGSKTGERMLLAGIGIGAMLGVGLAFVLLQWFGWGVVITVAVIGSFLGGFAGLVVGGTMANRYQEKLSKPLHDQWASEHPNLSDPSRPAIYVSQIYHGPKDAKGHRKVVDGIYCQCDAYGETLLRVPYYRKVNDMVQGKISVEQLLERLKDT